MTESTGVKGEMHCHSGFLTISGAIKQQAVRSKLPGDSSPRPWPYPGPAGGGGLTASPGPSWK